MGWKKIDRAQRFVLVLVLVLERVGDVASILWTGLGKDFVPKGPSDRSLAVYCQASDK